MVGVPPLDAGIQKPSAAGEPDVEGLSEAAGGNGSKQGSRSLYSRDLGAWVCQVLWNDGCESPDVK